MVGLGVYGIRETCAGGVRLMIKLLLFENDPLLFKESIAATRQYIAPGGKAAAGVYTGEVLLLSLTNRELKSATPLI